MWAAIRYRRAQALALLLLSALITACAVFAPLYERALEQSLLRDRLTRQSEISTSIVGESVQTAAASADPAPVVGRGVPLSARPAPFDAAATCGPDGSATPASTANRRRSPSSARRTPAGACRSSRVRARPTPTRSR